MSFGNISHRLGQPISTSQTLERLKNVKMADNAQETLDRTVEHLSENKVTLDNKAQFQCGQYLKFNPASESFENNEKANFLLTREYRAPFVVPSAGNV